MGCPLRRPGQDGAPDDDREKEAERVAQTEASDPWWKKASLTTVAMSQACATTSSAVVPPTATARTTKRLVVRGERSNRGSKGPPPRRPETAAVPVVPGVRAGALGSGRARATALLVVRRGLRTSSTPALCIWRSHCGQEVLATPGAEDPRYQRHVNPKGVTTAAIRWSARARVCSVRAHKLTESHVHARRSYVHDHGREPDRSVLPLVPLTEELTIALLICVDMGVAFAETAGRELAELMAPATTRDRRVGGDDGHSARDRGQPRARPRRLRDPAQDARRSTSARRGRSRCTPSPPTSRSACAWTRHGSTRCGAPGRRRGRRHLDGRLAVVGASSRASDGRRAGGHRDAHDRGRRVEEALGEDAALVRTLGAMPLFHPDGSGGLVEDWG